MVSSATRTGRWQVTTVYLYSNLTSGNGSPRPHRSTMGIKRSIDFAASVLLPICVVLVAGAEHFGAFDHLRGLDKVQVVADRFDESYAPDASRPVYPEDTAWKPTIALIEKYAKVKLRADRKPQTIARLRASLSTKDNSGYEWTSPSTPFAVLYVRWPRNTGVPIPQEDFSVVGSIGDLQNWIIQSRNDLHFIINDVLLGVLAAALGYWGWRIANRTLEAPDR